MTLFFCSKQYLSPKNLTSHTLNKLLTNPLHLFIISRMFHFLFGGAIGRFDMVVSVLQVPNSGFKIDHESVQIIAPLYLVKDNEVRARICGVLSPERDEDRYKFLGNFEINCVLVCDRCLQDVTFSRSSEICEQFSKDVSEGCQPINGEELDFTEVIRANVCNLLPMKISCTDDCLGLCSMCGKNLNKEQCSCEKPIDPRFAELSSFFKEEV